MREPLGVALVIVSTCARSPIRSSSLGASSKRERVATMDSLWALAPQEAILGGVVQPHAGVTLHAAFEEIIRVLKMAQRIG